MAIKNDNGEAAAAFYDKRRKWLDYVNTNPRIGHASFRVAFFIAQRMSGENQASWYSVRQIADRLSMSTHTVSAAIVQLEAEGLLIPVRTLGRRSSYLITGGPE
jgi:DNA-binding MarR family transcriptional regulator